MNVHELFGAPPPNPLVESKLFNAARRTVTLLVEGGFDVRFWRIYSAAGCLVRHQDQGGRRQALNLLQAARLHPDSKLLAVLDADLDRLEQGLSEFDNVVWTDAHDLETTLLCLPVLEKLLRQKVEAKKVAEAELRWGETVRTRLFRHALGMGHLRWLKYRRSIDQLVFAKDGKGKDRGKLLRFDRYESCTQPDWSPSLYRIIDAVTDYNNAHLLREQLKADLAVLPEAPVEQVCNGHDLVGFLRAWLKIEVGTDPGSADVLADTLAVACERTWLESTSMWKAIRDWEARHSGFTVLTAPAM